MSKRNLTETGRDRAALAHGAGFGRISFVSALAGVLVAFGAMAVLVSAAAATAEAVGVADQLSLDDWTRLGLGSAFVVVTATLVAYMFGGYVAGRMARRAGLLNGLAMFVLAVLLVAVLGALVTLQTGTDQVTADLRAAGITSSPDQWDAVASAAGLGSLLAMLVGALLGGKLGERWHSKLTRRAAAALADREMTTTMERETRDTERDVIPPARDATREPAAERAPDEAVGAEGRQADRREEPAGSREHLRG
jgi:hypothetical protein